MRIIDRYVLAQFIKNYLISFMVLIGMYIVLDMVFNFHDLVGIKGRTAAGETAGALATLRNIGDYYFYQAFLIFVHLSGVIPVVAAAFTLMRLSRFNELTAMLAAGVPLLRIAMPIILCGVVLNALMIVDQEVVIPRMLPKLSRSHDDVHRSDTKSFPIRAMQDANESLVYAVRYTPPADGKPAVMEMLDVIERGEMTAIPPPATASATGAGTPLALASVDPDAGTGEAARGAAGRADPAVDAQGDATTGPSTASARSLVEPKAHISADRAVWNEAEQRWDLYSWDPATKEYLPGGRRVTGLSPGAERSATERIAFYQSNVTPEEIALYGSGDLVELLSTARIDELIARPGSYGQANLLRVKHWRFTQPVMNVILLLLAIPCVLTREPGHLKAGATRTLLLTGLGMGSVFLSHQLAGNPPPDPNWHQTWPALMAWVPIFIFGPLAVLLLDRVKS